MTVTANEILRRLPPYEDRWEVIVDQQHVKDIIREIIEAHRIFAPYYDRFSSLFLCESPSQVAEALYTFEKQNIRYREEGVEAQTSALPTGFLTRGYGDCKHYALFNAGVLASLNRLYKCGFDWCFYFAAYDGGDEPYHVFVAVRDGPEEIWIDPTPGAGDYLPTLLIKRKA
jgi:hypothetical protein